MRASPPAGCSRPPPPSSASTLAAPARRQRPGLGQHQSRPRAPDRHDPPRLHGLTTVTTAPGIAKALLGAGVAAAAGQARHQVRRGPVCTR